MTKNNTLEYRVAQLEKNYDRLDTKLSAIMENHLPHLEQKMERITTKINVLTAVNIGAVILGIVVSKIL
jgi:chaperonin cofactor prefoldin